MRSLFVAVFLAAAVPAIQANAGVITIADYAIEDPASPSGTLALEFRVARQITLVPGETGYLSASLYNSGTLPISFQEYDVNSPRGYGWNFNEPGLAIGGGGMGYTGSHGVYSFKLGRVADPYTQGPDFSYLNGVSIAPGETLIFTLLSLNISAPVGSAYWLDTATQLGFGAPLFVGQETSEYSVRINMGTEFSSGPLGSVPLTHSWRYVPTVPTPEPTALALLSIGLIGMGVAKRRAPRRALA